MRVLTLFLALAVTSCTVGIPPAATPVRPPPGSLTPCLVGTRGYVSVYVDGSLRACYTKSEFNRFLRESGL
jgi:hypothetical protein